MFTCVYEQMIHFKVVRVRVHCACSYECRCMLRWRCRWRWRWRCVFICVCEQMIHLKVVTPQLLLNYAQLMEEKQSNSRGRSACTRRYILCMYACMYACMNACMHACKHAYMLSVTLNLPSARTLTHTHTHTHVSALFTCPHLHPIGPSLAPHRALACLNGTHARSHLDAHTPRHICIM